mmetsp:Transcript_41841/g.99245  ORF Transcript_41841/g.99245 Transcript_41841/m.99245 type:complete len:508 (+) Transcript_41841:242-1765(+)
MPHIPASNRSVGAPRFRYVLHLPAAREVHVVRHRCVVLCVSPAPIQALEGFPDCEVPDGQHVRPPEVEHHEHVGAPLAEALDPKQERKDLGVARCGKHFRGEPSLLELVRQELDILGLPRREPGGPERLHAQRRRGLGGDPARRRLAGRLETRVDGRGGLGRQLLVDDALRQGGERVSAKARHQAGRRPDLGDHPCEPAVALLQLGERFVDLHSGQSFGRARVVAVLLGLLHALLVLLTPLLLGPRLLERPEADRDRRPGRGPEAARGGGARRRALWPLGVAAVVPRGRRAPSARSRARALRRRHIAAAAALPADRAAPPPCRRGRPSASLGGVPGEANGIPQLLLECCCDPALAPAAAAGAGSADRRARVPRRKGEARLDRHLLESPAERVEVLPEEGAAQADVGSLRLLDRPLREEDGQGELACGLARPVDAPLQTQRGPEAFPRGMTEGAGGGLWSRALHPGRAFICSMTSPVVEGREGERGVSSADAKANRRRRELRKGQDWL